MRVAAGSGRTLELGEIALANGHGTPDERRWHAGVPNRDYRHRRCSHHGLLPAPGMRAGRTGPPRVGTVERTGPRREGRARDPHREQGLRPSTIDIVRRHLASREGLPFHPATLLEDRRRLDALRLFSAIEIKPVAAGAEVYLRST